MIRRWRPRPSTLRERRHGLIALAVVIFLLVALGWTTSHRGSTSEVIDEGDTLDLSSPLHGSTSHEVRVPGARVGLWVEDPVDEVAGGLAGEGAAPGVDVVRAEEGSQLLPITVTLRPMPLSRLDLKDVQRTEISLVHDGTTVELPSDTVHEGEDRPGRSLVVAVDEDVDHGDITIEVEYDGLTQVVSPESGDVESGAAAPLYEEAVSWTTGCAHEEGCHLDVVERNASWRPRASETELVTDDIVTDPYVEGLGWADEGKVWASLDFSVGKFITVQRADGVGGSMSPAGQFTVTLDEKKAKHVVARSGSQLAIFPIDAGSSPKKLSIERKARISEAKDPGQITLRKTMALESAQ